MENNIIFLSKSKLILALAFWSCFFTVLAQSEDKSYLKQFDPASKTGIDNFIPISKYGPVVTLSNLPEAIKNPTYYHSARFSNLALVNFPDELFLFVNLEEIDISGNSLTKLPSRLNELKNLKALHVNKNLLTSLNTEITSCSMLEVLQIQDNPLESISKEIEKVTTLKELTIGGVSRNCTIPVEVWNLTNLIKLKLVNVNLTEIPPSVAGLKKLDELCLSSNSITEIPVELYLLTNITYINLGYNKLNVIPSSIKAFENLDYLGVYYNPVNKFPEEIGNLKKLSFLSCWGTSLPPAEIEKVKKKLPLTKVHDTETDLH
ncbi:MAG: leucine-rich repeat domain-containing protein [Bacteroidota bacterium]